MPREVERGPADERLGASSTPARVAHLGTRPGAYICSALGRKLRGPAVASQPCHSFDCHVLAAEIDKAAAAPLAEAEQVTAELAVTENGWVHPTRSGARALT